MNDSYEVSDEGCATVVKHSSVVLVKLAAEYGLPPSGLYSARQQYFPTAVGKRF